jgi:hypothetical protein
VIWATFQTFSASIGPVCLSNRQRIRRPATCGIDQKGCSLQCESSAPMTTASMLPA